MMALTQENVHYTLNSGPGDMNKSNRVHARIQDFLSGRRGRGGGEVEAQRPENSHITCDFPGGGGGVRTP